MGWSQKIEYVDVEVTLPPPVKKQIWDQATQTFVPMTLYRHRGILTETQEDWMRKTFGCEGVYKNGRFWDYSRGGDFTIMDEKVYTWFKMKWA
jgi:hypothetical protein